MPAGRDAEQTSWKTASSTTTPRSYVRVPAEMADGARGPVSCRGQQHSCSAEDDGNRALLPRGQEPRREQTGAHAIVDRGAQVPSRADCHAERADHSADVPTSHGKNDATPGHQFPPESHRPLRRPPPGGALLFHQNNLYRRRIRRFRTPAPQCSRIMPPLCGPPSASSGETTGCVGFAQTTQTPRSHDSTARDREKDAT